MQHADCVCNQLEALITRVFGIESAPKVNTAQLKRLEALAKRLSRQIHKRPAWSLEEVVEHYKGKKRVRYGTAAAIYRKRGFRNKDHEVTLMVKDERKEVPSDYLPQYRAKAAAGSTHPNPRAIQFRGPVHGVVLARFLKPIESDLYDLQLGIFPSTLHVVGKGKNLQARAALCVAKWRKFKNPVCVSVDASRFDRHVNIPLLKVEHGVYLRAHRNHPLLRMLLQKHLRNKGRSRLGVRYTTEGNRMSGDMNTALGNCILMLLMVVQYVNECHNVGKHFEILDDGDDCLLFLEREELDIVNARMIEYFAGFGMKLKLECIAHRLSDIEWCQTKLIETAEGWMFVPCPSKVLSRTLLSRKFVQFKGEKEDSYRKRVAELVWTIGKCESVLNRGVPILFEFARALMRVGQRPRKSELTTDDAYYYRLGDQRAKYHTDVDHLPITSKARLDFHMAFNIAPASQERAEVSLNTWEFPLTATPRSEQFVTSEWTFLSGLWH